MCDHLLECYTRCWPVGAVSPQVNNVSSLSHSTTEPGYTISINNSCSFDLVLYIVSHRISIQFL